MKIGTMLKDILDSFFKNPATQMYPFEKITPPERYRGALVYNPKICTGCSLCVKDCPSNAIELVIIDRAAKRFVLTYHTDRCVYCGQCVVNCKPKCMGMSNEDWEHAALKKEFTVHYGKDEDVAEFLAKLNRTVSAAVDTAEK
jgi:formate hydrogenlyase subunit 6/NADH:ubiquinone oxidoreductase subunit I